jgi:hypothetical protein
MAKRLACLAAVLLVAVGSVLWSAPVHADYHGQHFIQRSLTIGTSEPSRVTTDRFSLLVPNKAAVGSLRFTYCETPLIAEQCVAPKGLDVSGAKLLGQTGVKGFTLTQKSQHVLVLSRAAAPTVKGKITFRFGNIVNPSLQGTFYVRITSYDSLDGSGTENGHGTVASSTAQTVRVSSKVPPVLNFCVGLRIPKPRDCSSANGHLIDMGTLSPSSTGKGSSQMLVATNASYGFGITAVGGTMSSGIHIIPALARPTYSAPGSSQFGINLRANSSPAVGKNTFGKGSARPTRNYSLPNQFMYKDGDTVASSNGVTDFNRFTVSYVANVAAAQEPGVYSTTITYICSGTF